MFQLCSFKRINLSLFSMRIQIFVLLSNIIFLFKIMDFLAMQELQLTRHWNRLLRIVVMAPSCWSLKCICTTVSDIGVGFGMVLCGARKLESLILHGFIQLEVFYDSSDSFRGLKAIMVWLVLGEDRECTQSRLYLHKSTEFCSWCFANRKYGICL